MPWNTSLSETFWCVIILFQPKTLEAQPNKIMKFNFYFKDSMLKLQYENHSLDDIGEVITVC